MYICSNCNSQMSDEKNFCEECGNPIAKNALSNSSNKESHRVTDKEDSSNLVLRTWKPWRWLFTEQYGELHIVKNNFSWNLYPAWRHPAIKVISQIFSYGFHVLGYLNTKGFSPIHNVNAVALFSPQWIKWHFSFFVINSGGFIGIYPVPAEDLERAKAFKQSLKLLSNNK
jgi:hypothetical protein